MEVLWDKGTATVGEVLEALSRRTSLAYTTVLTTLRILEQKGYLGHVKQGRAFVYHPLVKRQDARRHALRYLVSRFFEGSPELLVLNLLESEELDPRELKRLRKRIEETR